MDESKARSIIADFQRKYNIKSSKELFHSVADPYDLEVEDDFFDWHSAECALERYQRANAKKKTCV